MEKNNPTMKMLNFLMEKLETIEGQLRRISLNQRNPLDDTYLDADEVCDLLKICKRTLQKHRDESSISFVQLGGKTLYRTSDIKELLEKNHQKAIHPFS